MSSTSVGLPAVLAFAEGRPEKAQRKWYPWYLAPPLSDGQPAPCDAVNHTEAPAPSSSSPQPPRRLPTLSNAPEPSSPLDGVRKMAFRERRVHLTNKDGGQRKTTTNAKQWVFLPLVPHGSRCQGSDVHGILRRKDDLNGSGGVHTNPSAAPLLTQAPPRRPSFLALPSQATDKTACDGRPPQLSGAAAAPAQSLREVYCQRCQALGLKRPNERVLMQLPDAVVLRHGVDTPVEMLDFSATYLGPKGCAAASSVFPLCPQLKEINFTASGLSVGDASHPSPKDATYVKEVFAALQSCTMLRTLNLSPNTLGDAGGRWLLALLRTNPSIKEVNVCGTSIPEPLLRKLEAHVFGVGGCYDCSLTAVHVGNGGLPTSQSRNALPSTTSASTAGAEEARGEWNGREGVDEGGRKAIGSEPGSPVPSRTPTWRNYRRVPPFVAAGLVELRLRLIRNRHCMQRVYDCFVLPDSVEKRVSMASTGLPSHSPGAPLTRDEARSLVHLELLGASLDDATLFDVQQGTCSWKAFFRGLRVLGVSSAARNLSQAIAFASACGVLCTETVQFGKLINLLRVHAVLALPQQSTSADGRGRWRLESGADVLAAYQQEQQTGVVYDSSPFYVKVRKALQVAEDAGVAGEQQQDDGALEEDAQGTGGGAQPNSDGAPPAFLLPTVRLDSDVGAGAVVGGGGRRGSCSVSVVSLFGGHSVSFSVIPSMLVGKADLEEFAKLASVFGPFTDTSIADFADGGVDEEQGGWYTTTTTRGESKEPSPDHSLARTGGQRGSSEREARSAYFAALRSYNQPALSSFLPDSSGDGKNASKPVTASGRVQSRPEEQQQQQQQQHRSVTWREKEFRDVFASDGLLASVSAEEIQFVMDRLYDARHALRKCLQATALQQQLLGMTTGDTPLLETTGSPVRQHAFSPGRSVDSHLLFASFTKGSTAGAEVIASPLRASPTHRGNSSFHISTASAGQAMGSLTEVDELLDNVNSSHVTASLAVAKDKRQSSAYTTESSSSRQPKSGSVCQWPVVEAQAVDNAVAKEVHGASNTEAEDRPLRLALPAPPPSKGPSPATVVVSVEPIEWSSSTHAQCERAAAAPAPAPACETPRLLVPMESIYNLCVAIVGVARQGVLQCVLGRCGIRSTGGDAKVDFDREFLAKLKLRRGEDKASALPYALPISPTPPVEQPRPSAESHKKESSGTFGESLPESLVQTRAALLRAAESRRLAPEEATNMWRCLSIRELQELVAPF